MSSSPSTIAVATPTYTVGRVLPPTATTPPVPRSPTTQLPTALATLAPPQASTTPTPTRTARAFVHPIAPPDGSVYTGMNLRTWDPAPELRPGWGDTRSYAERASDAEAVDMGGKPLAIVWAYAAWQDDACRLIPFTGAALSAIQATDRAFGRQVTPILEWFAQGDDPSSPAYHCVTTKDIAAGTYDDYIRQYARDVREWGRPLFIRGICGEMNGSWWWSCSPRANPALSAADFANAWRRAVDIFRGEGASNAAWVWTPMADLPNTDTGLDQYWPGDGYVDWAGGDMADMNTPSDLDRLYAFALTHHKPFFLAEFGIRHTSATQATTAAWSAWLTGIFDYVEGHPQVKAISYFNYKGTYDADTSGNVTLYGGRVNYRPNVNDHDQRLLAGGPEIRALYASRVANSRYISSVAAAP